MCLGLGKHGWGCDARAKRIELRLRVSRGCVLAYSVLGMAENPVRPSFSSIWCVISQVWLRCRAVNAIYEEDHCISGPESEDIGVHSGHQCGRILSVVV